MKKMNKLLSILLALAMVLSLSFFAYAAEDEEEVIPDPAGPVDCVMPGTLEYNFATDLDATAGVIFRWTATADGELSVPRMGDNYMTNVLINGTYGEIGDYGYVVKTNDVVDLIVYGYGAGSVSVSVEFEISGGSDWSAVGTAENPEVIPSVGVAMEKTLESGEYYYQFTAVCDDELVISTTGDGTHNMEVYINGDTTMIYSNWDNDGEYIKLPVAAGDVLTMKVYFDWPGAGTISFEISGVQHNQTSPVNPDSNQPTGDAIFTVLTMMTLSGMGLTALISRKK